MKVVGDKLPVTNDDDDGTCVFCCDKHEGVCPLVCAIQYYESGKVMRVEFFSALEVAPFGPDDPDDGLPIPKPRLVA